MIQQPTMTIAVLDPIGIGYKNVVILCLRNFVNYCLKKLSDVNYLFVMF